MSTEAEVHDTHDTHESAHPGPGEYIKIAVILAIVTAAEVGAYYVKGLPDHVFAAMLLVMMAVKLTIVGLWFMHLRFDSPLFRRLFIAGLVLALSLFLIVLLIFGVFGGQPRVQV